MCEDLNQVNMISCKGLHVPEIGLLPNPHPNTPAHSGCAAAFEAELWVGSDETRQERSEQQDTPVRLLYVLWRRSLLQAQHFVQAVSRRGQFTLRSVLVLHVSGF